MLETQKSDFTSTHQSLNPQNSPDISFTNGNNHSQTPDEGLMEELRRKYIKPFDVSEEQLVRMMNLLGQEMEIGLSQEGHLRKTPVQMENTYVSELLDGTEHGSYLAIDLGGTRFRVHYVTVDGSNISAQTTPYPLPQNIIQGEGKDLFRYIATCLSSFLDEKNLKSRCDQLSLGFCFSFPIIQKSLNSGLLLVWTKDFKCSGVEGNDVVAMLKEALTEQGLNIKVSAILNDSTGTLVAGSVKDPTCCMSVIIGTGSNAAYLEEIDNIGMWEGHKHHTGKFSVIDMEWGAFGDNGIIDYLKTPFDHIVDQNSKHPGSFSFEKLFSGLYLGEVFRVVLFDYWINYHLVPSRNNMQNSHEMDNIDNHKKIFQKSEQQNGEIPNGILENNHNTSLEQHGISKQENLIINGNVSNSALGDNQLNHIKKDNLQNNKTNGHNPKLSSNNIIINNSNSISEIHNTDESHLMDKVKILNQKWGLPTKCVSGIEEAASVGDEERFSNILLNELGIFPDFLTAVDKTFMKELCAVLISRAAKLVAAAMASVLHRMKRKECGIAIDGSMYKLVPRLHALIVHWLTKLYPHGQVKIFLSEDGSGKGAALVASIADRLCHKLSNCQTLQAELKP